MPDDAKNKSIPELYEAIGSAISNWTRIEIQLHHLFSITLSLTIMQPGGGFSADHRVPSAVLDSVDGFRAKLLMIDAALNAALSDLDDDANLILSDWGSQRRKVGKLHWNRNCLAHWTVAKLQNPDGTVNRVVLRPPAYSSRTDEGVTETDVRGWEEAFIQAQDRLVSLVERLASHRGLQRGLIRQVTEQVRCSLPDTSALDYLKGSLP